MRSAVEMLVSARSTTTSTSAPFNRLLIRWMFSGVAVFLP
jgi:hypothetical protein